MAAITRTFARIGWLPPTRSNSRSCRTRRSGPESPRAARRPRPGRSCRPRRARFPSRRWSGTGERPRLVAEQLRRDERRRDRRTVDGDEGPRGALRPLVDGSRDELLSRARLPRTRTVESVGATLEIRASTALERRRCADDLLEHRGAVDFLTQRDVLLDDPLLRCLAVLDVGRDDIPRTRRPVSSFDGTHLAWNQRGSPSLPRSRISSSNGRPRLIASP